MPRHIRVFIHLCLGLFLWGPLATHPAVLGGEATPEADLVLIQGAGGESQYETAFGQWCQIWQATGASLSMAVHVIGPGGAELTDRERLRQTLQHLVGQNQRPLWMVYVGHGTYFQGQGKLNLTGPDVTADELAEWLQPLEQPVAIILCSSCSGAFLDRLSAPHRVIVTATRSGAEQNYSRFGQYLAEALQGQAADVDHDGAVSLLEAFLLAGRRTQAFYDTEGRLATEHALLDDNGDRSGTPADFFRGIRVVKSPSDDRAVDGLRAHQWMLSRDSDQPQLTPAQQAERDELETAIEALRQQRSALSDDQYYAQLEDYLVRLAKLTQCSEK
jgi:hypothetical protein